VRLASRLAAGARMSARSAAQSPRRQGRVRVARLRPSAPPTVIATRVLSQIPLLAMGVAVLFPLYFMVSNSFKSDGAFAANALKPATSPTLSKYASALTTGGLGRFFLNSLIITIVSVTVATLAAALAAYALGTMTFRGRETIFRVMLPTMAVPSIVLLVPQFRLMAHLGLINTRWSVIILYIGVMLPLSIYLFRNVFLAFPRELLDAAALDGCGVLATFWRVLVPASRPAVITTLLVNTVFAWNELLLALVFLQSQQQRTLVVGLTVFSSLYSLDVPELMAGMTLATIPVVVFYLFGQRFLVRGLMGGVGR
jgi:ABC-type glycerol-3-phosphate transport system permease component